MPDRKPEQTLKPATRVYQVADFVWFHHSRHKDTPCATCHGEVSTLSRIEKPFRGLSMQDCISCHKQHNASNACTICHELGQ
jgi:hypothetical protein